MLWYFQPTLKHYFNVFGTRIMLVDHEATQHIIKFACNKAPIKWWISKLCVHFAELDEDADAYQIVHGLIVTRVFPHIHQIVWRWSLMWGHVGDEVWQWCKICNLCTIGIEEPIYYRRQLGRFFFYDKSFSFCHENQQPIKMEQLYKILAFHFQFIWPLETPLVTLHKYWVSI